jgi:hypothetical protein
MKGMMPVILRIHKIRLEGWYLANYPLDPGLGVNSLPRSTGQLVLIMVKKKDKISSNSVVPATARSGN